VALSPRETYVVAGLLGLAAAGIVAVMHASPESETAASLSGTPRLSV
jgi:hypothetical protein